MSNSNPTVYGGNIYDAKTDAVVPVNKSTEVTIGTATYHVPGDVLLSARPCGAKEQPFNVPNPAPALYLNLYATQANPTLPGAGTSVESVSVKTNVLTEAGPSVVTDIEVKDATVVVTEGKDYTGRPFVTVAVSAGEGISRTDGAYVGGKVEGNSTVPCQPYANQASNGYGF